MADKKSFLIYHQHLSLFHQLTDEQAGILIKAIMEHEANHVIPDFKQDALLTGFFFGVFKPYLDEHRIEYKKKCQKKSENIKKRWNKDTDVLNSLDDVSLDTTEYNCIQLNTTEYNCIENIQANTNDSRLDKSSIDKSRLEKKGVEEDIEDSPAPSLDINQVVDFFNQNIGCCTSHIYECLLDTAKQYGIPNTLRACQLACERGRRTIGYINATAKGLFTTGEFKQESEDVLKAEPYTSEFAKIAESKLEEWGNEELEFGDDIFGTG